MIERLLAIAICLTAVPAMAEIPWAPGVTAPGLKFVPPLAPNEPFRGGFVIDELGFGNALRAQSRAVEFLSREFSRAAAQGLIEAQSAPNLMTKGVPTTTLEGRSNLSVVTAIDRDTLVRANVPPTASGAICLSDQDVDLASWGDTSDFRYLGKLRSAAIDESGAITSNGATKLARYYIALGFGAEAAALTKFIQSPAKRDVILAMAEVLDRGASDSLALNGQIFCEGAVSLWAALARPFDPQSVPRSTNAILTTFSSLPFHLRSHLGPLLAERLRSAGLNEQARNALNAVTRGGTHTEESALVAARLGLTGTRPDQSRDTLLMLSRGTDVTAAEALLELLEDAERRAVPPDVSWVDDVASLVRATEGTDASAALNLAGFRGMITLKRYDDVRLEIKKNGPGLSDETRTALATRALGSATEHASDAAFIRSELGFSKLMNDGSLSRDEALAVATRLSDLGLTMRALTYLPSDPKTIEELRTSSRVLSATGQTLAAVSLLDATPELAADLGGLLAMQGDVDRALIAFSQGGQIGSATLLAVRTGNWKWVAESGVQSVSDPTKVLLAPIAKQSLGPANGALLQDSQNRRLQAALMLELLASEEISNAFTN